VQEAVCENNSRVLLLVQCYDSFKLQGNTVCADADAWFPS
jgi:hypothetical protein